MENLLENIKKIGLTNQATHGNFNCGACLLLPLVLNTCIWRLRKSSGDHLLTFHFYIRYQLTYSMEHAWQESRVFERKWPFQYDVCGLSFDLDTSKQSYVSMLLLSPDRLVLNTSVLCSYSMVHVFSLGIRPWLPSLLNHRCSIMSSHRLHNSLVDAAS